MMAFWAAPVAIIIFLALINSSLLFILTFIVLGVFILAHPLRLE